MSLIVLSSAMPCLAEGLAGISSADDIWSFDFLPVDFFDVPMIWHLRPVFLKDFAGIRV
jgi:hypothetical protein